MDEVFDSRLKLSFTTGGGGVGVTNESMGSRIGPCVDTCCFNCNPLVFA
jgi:hypothetical protein